MKRYLLVLVLAIGLILTACGTKTENKDAVKEEPKTEQAAEKAEEKTEAKPEEKTEEKAEEKTEEKTAEREFTLEELKEFDGKDGRPAYIAVDGVVYDVTNVEGWKGGEHNGVKAGTDGTVPLKEKSPHGVSKLTDLPVVGKLAK